MSPGFFEDFFEDAPDMFVSVDAFSRKITDCNATVVKRLSYGSRGEIVGRDLLEIYDESSHDMVKSLFKDFTQRGYVTHENILLRGKDGTPIRVGLKATSIKNRMGNIIKSRSVLRETNRWSEMSHLISFLATLKTDLGKEFAERIGSITDLVNQFNELDDVFEKLSTRELRVLKMLLAGQLNKSIARRIGVSQRTVESTRSRLQVKFQVDSSAELIGKATTHKILMNVFAQLRQIANTSGPDSLQT